MREVPGNERSEPKPSVPAGEEELYRRRREEAKDTDVTDRTLQEYCDVFGITPQDLAGKRILDAGSGFRERFSKQASAFGAEVISLNPNLDGPDNRAGRRRRAMIKKAFDPDEPAWQGRSVAGLAQELPFKDKPFDIVTALGAPPARYLHNTEETLRVIKEMAAVLKPGGVMYISPGSSTRNDTRDFLDARTLAWLRENGYEINLDRKDAVTIRKPGGAGQ